MRRLAAGLVALTVLACWLMAGCSTVDKPIASLSSAGHYRAVSLGYRATLNAKAAAGSENLRQGTLLLVYPHPGGKQGLARAEYVIERPTAANASSLRKLGQLASNHMPGVALGDGIESSIGLDLPIGEVDKVMGKLDEAGFFGSTGGYTDGAAMVVHVDGLDFCKRWQRVSEIDGLIRRVQTQGSVVSRRDALDPSEFHMPAAGEDVLRLPTVR